MPIGYLTRAGGVLMTGGSWRKAAFGRSFPISSCASFLSSLV